jgi:cytochrome c551/c552
MKVSVVGLAVACLLIGGSAFAEEVKVPETAASCNTCHKLDEKGMGGAPSWKKMAEDGGVTAERIEKAIVEGTTKKEDGTALWEGATMTMPAQGSVTPEDAKKLAEELDAWMKTLGE